MADGRIGARRRATARDPGTGRFARYAGEREARIMEPEADRGARNWITKAGDLASSMLTDAMGTGGAINTLALVPGRALFEELGRDLMSAATYLDLKGKMDALRNDWQAKTAAVVDDWTSLARKKPRENAGLMQLMHDTTRAGFDPSAAYQPHPSLEWAKKTVSNSRAADYWRDAAQTIIAGEAARRATYDTFKARYDALPAEMQAMYRRVRDGYTAIADEMEKAVIENIDTAMEIQARRARREHAARLREIEDDGLIGPERDEAIAEAEKNLATAIARNGWSKKARMAKLRQVFESNRLQGPYFPLARFGKYFVTVRDGDGKVVSFSRFETEREQKKAASALAREKGVTVDTGVLGDKDTDLSQHVSADFVADVMDMLGENASPEMMEAVWQRWLETLPDSSIRLSQIHRKNRDGFSTDAVRAFAHHQFHGAHQLARLKFGLRMEDALDEARLEAAKADDSNRAGLVVDEMQRRHAFTMNPAGSQWSAMATSLAFIWYLGVSPAAALVNISQTTIMGPPIMKAAFPKASYADITRHLGRAMRDFANRGMTAGASARLTAAEKAALDDAYEMGVVDKTQSHDLASVAENGIEYRARREKIMRGIAWLFHKAEVMNREVTFLAAYRIGVEAGMDAKAAIENAASITWKTHFDYQNTSRARFMQGDIPKVIFIFKSFTVNMLWRLFRDTHQMVKGKSPETRREARTQLVGITISMMAHAGITGVWGWGLAMTLAAMFFPDMDDDDLEAAIIDAALLEGDGAGVSAWNYAMGMAFKGIPGHATGIDLTNRIGMPDLWFRNEERDMSGAETWQYLVGEFLGPIAGLGANWARAADLLGRGEWWRATEAAVPKFVRDVMRGGRFASEGVETINGDTIIENVTPLEALAQASGFTPARLSERYATNSRMMNAEERIEGERTRLQRRVGDAIRAGEPVPAGLWEKVSEFNRRYPEYPITAETIRASVRSREQASARNEFGVALNPRLNDRIRADAGATIYN